VGAVVLSVGYKLFLAWIDFRPEQPLPTQGTST
jgi:hypothetical protein